MHRHIKLLYVNIHKHNLVSFRDKYPDFFRIFQHNKSNGITTNYSIVYGLLTHIRQQTTMDIELSVPTMDTNLLRQC